MGDAALSVEAGGARLLARWYAVLLIAACFGWPLILGIAPGAPRAAWLFIAVVLVLCSVLAARSAAKRAAMPSVETRRPPWLAFAVPALLVAAASIFPVTFFSDEEAIALPSLLLLTRAARLVTWPGLAALFALCIGSAAWFRRRLRGRHVWALLALLCTSSVVLAFLHARPEALLIRFPPLLHLGQILATAAGLGRPALMRLGNAGWTFLLFLSCWTLLPRWPVSARIALGIAALLTPLGWTYRLLLFQACGEITLGLAAVFLLDQVIRRPDGDYLGLYPGMLLGAWILYRPTSLAIACAVIGLLALVRRRRAALDIALIALPMGALWVSVYVLGSFQYAFLSASSDRTFALWRPLMETLAAVPEQLGWVGIAVLLAGSTVLALRRPSDRVILLLAWMFGVTSTLLHQLLTVPVWYGYGRFSVLLMLPLAVTVGALAAWAAERRRAWLVLPLIALLAWTTPWPFVRFLQERRAVGTEDYIERTVTGGSIPTPLPQLIEEHATDAQRMIVLSPSYAFLDLLVARGLFGVAQRESIIARSRAWTPSSPGRPVLIQAPQPGRTYRTNITADEERRLLEAAAWARTQPGVREEVFGSERVLVVPFEARSADRAPQGDTVNTMSW